MEINEELAELIGCFMGDGGLHHSKNCHYSVYFTGHNLLDFDYYKNRIVPIVLRYFDSKATLKKIKGKNAIRVVFNSKELYYYFLQTLNLGKGKKSDIVEVPIFIKDNEKLFRSLIRGLYDTDGSVFLDKRLVYSKPYPRILHYTTSIKLHEQLRDYLSNYFKFYTYKRIYKEETHGDAYALEIYGEKNLYKWMELIGFSNKRHLDKIAHVA